MFKKRYLNFKKKTIKIKFNKTFFKKHVLYKSKKKISFFKNMFCIEDIPTNFNLKFFLKILKKKIFQKFHFR